MRLAVKLTLALSCAILVVLATNSLIRVRRELALFKQDMRKDDELLGRAVAGAASRIWYRVGEAEAMDVVDDANERETHVYIRWVWLDAPAGHPDAPLPASASEDAMVTYVPVAGPTDRRVALELRESLDAQKTYIRDTILQALIATTVLVVLCTVLVLGFGVVLVGRPVRRLVEHARRVADGDLSARLVVSQRDEIGVLGHELNEMSARLEVARARVAEETDAKLAAMEQLRHADRLATVGRLAAGIAHEVGTPLNVIAGYAQLVGDDAGPGTPTSEHAAIIGAQVKRVTAIVRQLLDFSRPQAARKAPQELGAVVRQAVSMLESIAQKRRVEIRLDVSEPVEVSGDAGQLQQVVANLVVNAIHASQADGAIDVVVGRRHAAPPGEVGGAAGAYACVDVVDRGTGIPPDALTRIFEPFFTTKDVGEGTGLGLSVAHGIIKEHGGWISVDSEVGRGSRFSFFLPLQVPGDTSPDRR